MNKGAVSGLGGKLKIWTLIIGAVVIGLAAHASFYKSYREHEVFFGSVIACFVISLVFILGALIGIMDGHDLFKKFDMIFHLLAALLLIASGIVFVIHINDHRVRSDNIFAEQVSAGTLSLLNGIIYSYIAWILH